MKSGKSQTKRLKRMSHNERLVPGFTFLDLFSEFLLNFIIDIYFKQFIPF